MHRLALSALAAIALCIGLVGSTEAQVPFKVEVRPPAADVLVFPAEGRLHAAFELTLSNLNGLPLTVDLLRVSGATKRRDKPFSRTWQGEELRTIFSTIAGSYTEPQNPLMPPGGSAFLFVFLDFQDKNDVPDEVAIRVVVHGNPGTPPQQIDAPAVPLSRERLFRVSPPLRGTNWWTPNAPSNFSRHRRTVVALDGQVWLAQRFAVDWLRLGANGSTFSGDISKNTSYFAYGAEVLAAADGRVVSTQDGIPDNVPKQVPPLTLDTIGGNNVVVRHDDQHFTFYAHLIPGSIRVRPGDRVRRGDVLGLLGNSGGSTEPHLHFHVSDRPTPMTANGIPYTFDRFWRRDYEIVCPPTNPDCHPTDGPTDLILGAAHRVTDEIITDGSLTDFLDR